MKALDLLVALCETDAEEFKYTHVNENGSLNKLMREGTWVGGFTLSQGTPKEGAMYLMVDALLEGCKPDLIYQHKGETYEATMFGYRVDEILTDEELNGEA
jgi:hypothetical protein